MIYRVAAGLLFVVALSLTGGTLMYGLLYGDVPALIVGVIGLAVALTQLGPRLDPPLPYDPLDEAGS